MSFPSLCTMISSSSLAKKYPSLQSYMLITSIRFFSSPWYVLIPFMNNLFLGSRKSISGSLGSSLFPSYSWWGDNWYWLSMFPMLLIVGLRLNKIARDSSWYRADSISDHVKFLVSVESGTDAWDKSFGVVMRFIEYGCMYVSNREGVDVPLQYSFREWSGLGFTLIRAYPRFGWPVSTQDVQPLN